jgi:hypothetical protein
MNRHASVVLISVLIMSLLVLTVSAEPSNMISYWQAEENSGTNLPDTLHNNNGQILGAAYATGIVGNALFFDGNDYVSIPDSDSLKPLHLTVEAWIYMDQLPTAFPNWAWPGWIASFISKFQCQGAQGDAGYVLGITTDSQTGLAYLDFGLGCGAGVWGWSWIKSGISLQTGVWYHVAGTYDGTYIKVYINGVERGSVHKLYGTYYSPNPYPGGFELLNSNTPLEIGGHYQLTGNNIGLERTFRGKIDEVAVYNEALPAEILNYHYLKGLDGIDYLGNSPFVVPEYFFGGLTALGACFAAFVVIKRPKISTSKSV